MCHCFLHFGGWSWPFVSFFLVVSRVYNLPGRLMPTKRFQGHSSVHQVDLRPPIRSTSTNSIHVQFGPKSSRDQKIKRSKDQKIKRPKDQEPCERPRARKLCPATVVPSFVTHNEPKKGISCFLARADLVSVYWSLIHAGAAIRPNLSFTSLVDVQNIQTDFIFITCFTYQTNPKKQST